LLLNYVGEKEKTAGNFTRPYRAGGGGRVPKRKYFAGVPSTEGGEKI